MEKISEETLVVERTIEASPKQIFEALTQESKLRQWFYPIKKDFRWM